jgi:hypothetical protein
MSVPRHVKMVKVGPRDGLRNEQHVDVSVNDKIRLITMLAAAGCQYVEAASFVSPKWVPSMANSLKVMQGLAAWKENDCWHLQHESSSSSSSSGNNISNNKKMKPMVLSCLVPNIQGLERRFKWVQMRLPFLLRPVKHFYKRCVRTCR